MAMPGIWQLSGYVMALFLSGFRGIPEELREAARMTAPPNGRSTAPPHLPAIESGRLSALVIVAHMSLKVFDLHHGRHRAVCITEVPATYMWTALTGGEYGKASAIATILLLLVCIFIVPYLISTARSERKARK